MKTHIQHLHESSVDWSAPDAAGARRKVLNADPVSGSLVAMVDVPAGWSQVRGAHAHAHPVEIYVLSGALVSGSGDTYEAGDYHYLPAGAAHGAGAGSPNGAVCVAQHGGGADSERVSSGWCGPGRDGDDVTDRATGEPRHLRPADFPWITHGEGANRSAMATVRTDAGTGAQMYVLDLPAGWRGKAGPHFHGVCEEVFVLEGDVALEDSPVYRAGSYLFRPPRVVHGSRERSVEGCRALVWTDGPLDFNYVDVEYALEP